MDSPRGIAARVAATYAAVAVAWILVSGMVTAALPKPFDSLVEVSKGLAFVAITAVALYVVISRWTARAAAGAQRATEAQRQVERVIATAPVGMLLIDEARVVTYANPRAERLLNARAAECVGRPLDVLCGQTPDGGFALALSELLATGAIDGLVIPASQGRSQRELIARSARMEVSETSGGWVIALADASRVQEQRERSERLLDMYRWVSGISAVLRRARDAGQLIGQLCDLAVNEAGLAAAWGFVRDAETGQYIEVGSYGLGESGHRAGAIMLDVVSNPNGALAERLGGSELIVVNDVTVSSGPWGELAQSAGFGSYVAFGIAQRGALLGGIALFAEQPGYWAAEERSVVTTLRFDLSYTLDRMALDARREEAQEALAQSEEGYRLLFDANPQPMLVHDRGKTRFLAVNDAMVQKYGYTREEFLTMTLADIRPAGEVPQLVEHLARKAPGSVYTGYWTHRDAQGREFPVQVVTHGIKWEGRDADLVLIQEVAHV